MINLIYGQDIFYGFPLLSVAFTQCNGVLQVHVHRTAISTQLHNLDTNTACDNLIVPKHNAAAFSFTGATMKLICFCKKKINAILKCP